MSFPLSQNLPASLSVDAALHAFLDENGFDETGYTADTDELTAGPFAVTIPNPPARQRVIAQHDLHHVLCGYGTDLVGEAEIGAWELRAGCTSAFLYGINLLAIAGGLVLAPHRVLRAWRSAAGQTTLYRAGISASEARERNLGELRVSVGIPRDGAADRPRQLHAKAPPASPRPRGVASTV